MGSAYCRIRAHLVDDHLAAAAGSGPHNAWLAERLPGQLLKIERPQVVEVPASSAEA
jgi:hypothetical protein